ncbi:MAG: Fe2+-dependent dioxygenase [Caulobacteraceae bacterium]|nr:Fe2+-dependent dioxygenase [Caulobacteraceae bacterium]
MIVHIPGVLSAEQVAQCRAVLEACPWTDGRATAGVQSALVKSNMQIPLDAPEAQPVRDLILERLGQSPTFVSAALPLRIMPPMFNRYDAGMGFGSHVDNAIRYAMAGSVRYRTDLSCTLFLSDPREYDGGELVIDDVLGRQAVRLPAGDMVLYPSASVHRVAPVTRGSRLASFFWVQSMIRGDDRRTLLFELDHSIIEARAALGDDHIASVRLAGAYHNLLRMWAEV